MIGWEPDLVAKLDQEDLFQNISLGSPKEKISGLSLLRDSEKAKGWTLYTRSDEISSFGGAEIKSIEYGFWKDQLGIIQVRIVGRINARYLMTTLRKTYGMCGQLPGYGCVWQSRKVQMRLEWRPAKDKLLWRITYLPLYENFLASNPPQ